MKSSSRSYIDLSPYSVYHSLYSNNDDNGGSGGGSDGTLKIIK